MGRKEVYVDVSDGSTSPDPCSLRYPDDGMTFLDTIEPYRLLPRPIDMGRGPTLRFGPHRSPQPPWVGIRNVHTTAPCHFPSVRLQEGIFVVRGIGRCPTLLAWSQNAREKGTQDL